MSNLIVIASKVNVLIVKYFSCDSRRVTLRRCASDATQVRIDKKIYIVDVGRNPSGIVQSLIGADRQCSGRLGLKLIMINNARLEALGINSPPPLTQPGGLRCQICFFFRLLFTLSYHTFDFK